MDRTLGLVGRPAEFTLNREGRAGTYVGLVRAATGWSGGAPTVVLVQRFSNPSATSASARYRGASFYLRGPEIESLRVYWRRRMIPFREWAARARTSAPAKQPKEG